MVCHQRELEDQRLECQAQRCKTLMSLGDQQSQGHALGQLTLGYECVRLQKARRPFFLLPG